MSNKEVRRPVPRKILVPALEKASLEDAHNHVMIELWANLLASAATGQKVEPRYVGIIAELSGSQAKCLSDLARFRAEESRAPHYFFLHARHDLSDRDIRSDMEALLRPYLGEEINRGEREVLNAKIMEWASEFSGPGVYLDAFSLGDVEYNLKIGEGLSFEESDLEILASLGLIRTVNMRFTIEEAPPSFGWGFAIYYHLTGLGVNFVSVCDPDLVLQFKAREDANKRA